MSFSLPAWAAEGEAEEFSPGEMITHHVTDAHEWHFADGLTLPLPVILYSADQGLEVFSSSRFYDEHHAQVEYAGYRYDHGHITPVEEGRHVYDLSITKNVASMFLSVILLFVVFFSISGYYKRNPNQPPRGLAAFFEPIIIFIRDDIAKPNIGPRYERYLPFLLTIFFFIWFNNLLGLLPGGANLTGNIAVTAVLAFFTLLITLFSGNKNYWSHIVAPPGVPAWLLPIMWPVEILGIFTKPFSLMVRLFANITAGHIIILSLMALIFIFQSFVIGPVSVAFATFMNFLELFVAILQAYIFTMLSAMYFGQAVEEHHDEAHA
nr:F0F1 ATP synthase subunit A [Catalinimonas alkaloidigena]